MVSAHHQPFATQTQLLSTTAVLATRYAVESHSPAKRIQTSHAPVQKIVRERGYATRANVKSLVRNSLAMQVLPAAKMGFAEVKPLRVTSKTHVPAISGVSAVAVAKTDRVVRR